MGCKIFSIFHKDERGAIAMIAAFAITTIVIIVGISVDYYRQVTFGEELRGAADNTILLASTYNDNDANRQAIANGDPVLTEEEHIENRIKIVEKTFSMMADKLKKENPNYEIDPLVRGENLIVNEEEGKITIKPSGRIIARMLTIVGMDKLEVSGKSYSATYNNPNPIPASIQMVIDLSGSMKFRSEDNQPYDQNTSYAIDPEHYKLVILKEAMHDLISKFREVKESFINTEPFSTGLVDPIHNKLI